MSLGQVLHAEHDGVHVLKFRGDIRFDVCAPAERFLSRIMEQGPARPFVIDLLETLSLDSTALGVMALVARYMQDHFGQRASLVVDHPDLRLLLHSVCFDQVFHFVEKGPEGELRFTVLEPMPSVVREFAERSLRAHQALSAISKENAERFLDVVQALAREAG